jgi:chromosome segregation ATPase
VAGGILGAVLSGGDKGKMAKYMALGAVIGGVAGGVVGNEVAKRKKAYATREALLEGETRRTAQFVAEIKKVNKSLRTDIAAYKRQIAQLKQNTRQSYASNRQLQTKLAEVQNREKEASKARASVDNELKIVQQMRDEAKTMKAKNAAIGKRQSSEFNSKIAALERERNELEKHQGELLAMGTAISY